MPAQTIHLARVLRAICLVGVLKSSLGYKVVTEDLISFFECWIHCRKRMEFDDSNDRGLFCISPTDKGFVEESDLGMRVWVGDVNREVECSRNCKVGLVSTGFLCLGFVFP